MSFDPKLDNRLKALGICPADLSRAITLIRDFRIQAHEQGIGPKATRIAILFAELSDRHYAVQKCTDTEMLQLHAIAKDLFETAKPKL
jgi:hypothetical protein